VHDQLKTKVRSCLKTCVAPFEPSMVLAASGFDAGGLHGAAGGTKIAAGGGSGIGAATSGEKKEDGDPERDGARYYFCRIYHKRMIGDGMVPELDRTLFTEERRDLLGSAKDRCGHEEAAVVMAYIGLYILSSSFSSLSRCGHGGPFN
jgi:hypothetical protein